MKRLLVPVSFAILAIMLSLSAFAKEKSTNVTLTQNASLNGTALPAGDYVVKYDVTGSNATVKFVKGKKEVASATGQVKTLAKRPVTTHLTIGGNGNDQSIQEIEFGGSDTSVSFGNGMGAGGQ